MKLTKKFAIATAGIALMGGALSGCDRVTDREVGIKTRFGKVTEEYKQGTGLVFYMPFVSQVHTYPLYMQTLTIAADQANLRTKDSQQIVGAIDFQYQIDPNRAAVKTLYVDFNDDWDRILHQLGKTSAVEVFGRQSAIDLTSNIDAVREQIRVDFQKQLDRQHLPFMVTSVAMSGIGLSKESNQKLEALMMEQQRSRVLDMRSINADKEKDVVAKETKVTIGAITELKGAGLSDDQALSAFCLQLAEKEKRVNEPFAPGCLPGTGSQSVSVAAPKR